MTIPNPSPSTPTSAPDALCVKVGLVATAWWHGRGFRVAQVSFQGCCAHRCFQSCAQVPTSFEHRHRRAFYSASLVGVMSAAPFEWIPCGLKSICRDQCRSCLEAHLRIRPRILGHTSPLGRPQRLSQLERVVLDTLRCGRGMAPIAHTTARHLKSGVCILHFRSFRFCFVCSAWT